MNLNVSLVSLQKSVFSPVPLKLRWENGYYLIVLMSLFPNT